VSRGLSADLLVVTDRRIAPDLPGVIARALAGTEPGRVAVMLREKDLGGRELLALARALREVTREAGARLLVNDRVDVMLAADADGVHLPEAGIDAADARRLAGEHAIVGVSTHGADAVRAAEAAGADYVTFGPVFDTPEKRRYGPPVGIEGLAALGARIPVFALGGVDPERTPALVRAGAAGVACIRAVLAADDPAGAVRAFLAAAAAK